MVVVVVPGAAAPATRGRRRSWAGRRCCCHVVLPLDDVILGGCDGLVVAHLDHGVDVGPHLERENANDVLIRISFFPQTGSASPYLMQLSHGLQFLPSLDHARAREESAGICVGVVDVVVVGGDLVNQEVCTYCRSHGEISP